MSTCPFEKKTVARAIQAAGTIVDEVVEDFLNFRRPMTSEDIVKVMQKTPIPGKGRVYSDPHYKGFISLAQDKLGKENHPVISFGDRDIVANIHSKLIANAIFIVLEHNLKRSDAYFDNNHLDRYSKLWQKEQEILKHLEFGDDDELQADGHNFDLISGGNVMVALQLISIMTVNCTNDDFEQTLHMLLEKDEKGVSNVKKLSNTAIKVWDMMAKTGCFPPPIEEERITKAFLGFLQEAKKFNGDGVTYRGGCPSSNEIITRFTGAMIDDVVVTFSYIREHGIKEPEFTFSIAES